MYQTIDRTTGVSENRIVIHENPDGTLEAVVVDEHEPASDDTIVAEGVDLPDWGADDRINIMLLGVDSRDQDGDVGRSDTIIIVTIDPKTNEVGMMSIPRDLQVEIPGLGLEKINAAYAQGGRDLTRAVVEYHFDIPIHYWAEVDFVGFINIVDIAGGVVVDNPALIKDDNYEWTRVYFPTGLQHMNGETALRYVRTRYDDNDFARGMRQQQVLVALRQQGVRLNLITRARELLEEVEDSFRTNLTFRQSLALARMANDIESENITSYSIIEATHEEWNPPAPYYLIPNWDAIHEIVREMIPPEETGVGHTADSDAFILVQNGTFVDQLAARNRQRLNDEGYTAVETGQAEDAGEHLASQIFVYGDRRETALHIADILGLDPESIVMENGEHPGGYDIVVILGDDAPNADSG
jgi:polyisoprenyl-teichoic acid--peptidoglycan teichoic acid transferase